MKIVLSGGGTLGPVTPLLAIGQTIKEKYPKAEFIWIGTKHGPERDLIKNNDIRFVSFSSGKFRRYFSIFNIIDLFKVAIGFFESLIFLRKERPDICISAGGFVSVPLHFAAKFVKIPTWIHQQDVRVGLSNKLMASFAKIITVALEQNTKNFPSKKVICIGNPVREDILNGSKEKAMQIFGLSGNKPVVFVTGGGTGAESINIMVADAIPHLKGVCEIIHLSGKKRPNQILSEIASKNNYYKNFSFFADEMKHAYAVADLVISRGGFGTLTELSALKKPAIIIPIPGHQEENVALLSKSGAVILLDQRTGNGLKLSKLIKDVLGDAERMCDMKNKLSKLILISKKENILNVFEKILV